MKTSFGPHLCLDLTGCNPAKLSDARWLYSFLSNLPATIGMNKMGEPHLDLYKGVNSEWGGWSGAIFIEESHISFHAFDFGIMFLDIFSCKVFDYEAAINFILQETEADKHIHPDFAQPQIESQSFVFERGRNFPVNLRSGDS